LRGATWFRQALVGVRAALAFAAFAPAAAFAADAPEGWTITKTDQAMVCVASGPSDGQAQLSIAAEGPLFLLLVSAPDLPQPKDSYPLALSIDGRPSFQLTGLGQSGTIGVNVGRGQPTDALSAASRLDVTVVGARTHRFAVHNLGAVFDAVARCAGQPPLSARLDHPQPIAGAPGWTLDENLPGASGACLARRPGPQIDILLMLNKDGDLILSGGHSDWATWGGQVPLELSLDGAPPVKLSASTVSNLILASIKDPALLQKLRDAKALDWTIPTGHVRGEVAGLGVALDAAKACKARQPK
jgi:hypothetical protein